MDREAQTLNKEGPTAMSRYLMFIKHSPDLRSEEVPQSLLEEMGEFIAENVKKGLLIDTAGLSPETESKQIRLARGKLTVTDGPFTESKEIIGGYALVEASTKQEAVDLATRFMDLHLRHWPEFEGACELRAIDGGESAASTSASESGATTA
jgi:hypothetical protein